jgi:hypothetical protein
MSRANSSPPMRKRRSGLADPRAQGLGDALERLVANHVAVLLVDQLEVVEIEQGEREHLVVSALDGVS